jgi:hypothetical protein
VLKSGTVSKPQTMQFCRRCSDSSPTLEILPPVAREFFLTGKEDEGIAPYHCSVTLRIFLNLAPPGLHCGDIGCLPSVAARPTGSLRNFHFPSLDSRRSGSPTLGYAFDRIEIMLVAVRVSVTLAETATPLKPFGHLHLRRCTRWRRNWRPNLG